MMAEVRSSGMRFSKSISLVLINCSLAFVFVSGGKSMKPIEASSSLKGKQEQYMSINYILKATSSFLWQSDQAAGYNQHVWPVSEIIIIYLFIYFPFPS